MQLIVKSLRKHGWPADFVLDEYDEWAFTIQHYDTGLNARDDFWQAVDIACRVMARLRNVDLIQAKGFCELARPYAVNERGEFRPIKT